MDEEGPDYKNPVSNVAIDRNINSMQYANFRDIGSEYMLKEFLNDINTNNDAIELSLINNKAYKEAVIMCLSRDVSRSDTLLQMIRDEQKTFGGSKLFYLNDSYDKVLVISVPRSMEGKLSMVLNRLNKINEKVARINSRIRKENLEVYMKRQSLKDKKDIIANMINERLKS